MRLKFYLIGVMALLIAGQSFGQNNAADDKYKPLYKVAPNDAPRDPKRDYSVNSEKQTVFEADFSEDESWIINSEGEQGEWEIVTETSPDVADFMGIMQSATAENGFAEFDAIQYLLSPDDVDVQNTTIEYDSEVGEIDCSELDQVVVIFNQRYRAFNIDQTSFELSTDGGNTWLQYFVNTDVVTNDPAIQGEVVTDVSAQCAGESDVRIRFRWVSDAPTSAPDWTQQEENSFGSGYGWLIDDLLIGAPIENDLVVEDTYYDDWFETFYFNADSNFYEFASEETTEEDITSSFEYHTMPNWATRPFNFAAIVTNAGSQEQTGVTLLVTFNPPDGGVPQEIPSDPITMAPGQTDTIRIYGEVPTAWANPVDGSYVIDYEVAGDQEDQLPGNNVGVSLVTRVTSSSQDEGAIAMHANSSTINLVAGNQEDLIIGTKYNFSEWETERVITHIEFVLGDETADNGIGQIVLLNMRNEGVGVVDAAGDVPYQENALFSYDPQDADAVPYVITDETPFTEGSDPNWISVELPEAILIDPNTVYQAEILLLPYGQDAVYNGYTSSREPGITVFYEPSAPDEGWGFSGTFHANLRFRTNMATSVDDVTYESGIKMTQNFPNPVVDNTRIQFQLDETSPVTFQVFDISGRLVFSEDLGNIPATTAHTIEFNREGFASGTYTYSIVTENDRVTRKMIIE